MMRWAVRVVSGGEGEETALQVEDETLLEGAGLETEKSFSIIPVPGTRRILRFPHRSDEEWEYVHVLP